ncbi:hypothetical protein Godav_017623 [Gossypium davidsonii]|uniref:RNase H type-1 domain-containing protein n=2 Tax=Gossypium TaxID=3633 RepID=A0A7J8QTV4_GOSDV|nr:hypothetical protein [Gossypium davidsonii]
MNCFLLPSAVCRDLEAVMARFWWQKKVGKKGLHWCSWKKLLVPKEEGGIGFRDLAKFNIALLANIWFTKGLLGSGLKWRIGSGTSVSIWKDYWLPGKAQRSISTDRVAGLDWVAELILNEPNRWNRVLIYSTFSVEETDQIMSLPIPTTDQSDKVVWFSDNSGIYFVKSGYKMLLDNSNGCESSTHAVRDCLFAAQPRSMVKWLPPPQGWVKINVDAGLSVAKNEQSLVVLHGLQFALDLGFSNVILESDSRLVVNNIQKSSEDYSESRLFTWDVKNLARKFQRCRFQFIAREGNGAAHVMAIEGMRTEGDLFWVEDAPLKALEVADSDRQSGRPP